MSVSDKIKVLLKLQGKNADGLSKALGLSSKQALYNKFTRNSFTANDLIKTADFLGCKLNFMTQDGLQIALNSNDMDDNQTVEHHATQEEMTMNNQTNLSSFSDEKIVLLINEYFENSDSKKNDLNASALIRALLFEAQKRSLFPDIEIRIMGSRIH